MKELKEIKYIKEANIIRVGYIVNERPQFFVLYYEHFKNYSLQELENYINEIIKGFGYSAEEIKIVNEKPEDWEVILAPNGLGLRSYYERFTTEELVSELEYLHSKESKGRVVSRDYKIEAVVKILIERERKQYGIS